jgi:hypothetical protein
MRRGSYNNDENEGGAQRGPERVFQAILFQEQRKGFVASKREKGGEPRKH